jgi:transposase
MVFIDESGANLAMTNDYARAEGGQRVNAPKPFDVGSKFSIVGAIALTGIVAMMYVEAAVNGEIFREFIRQFLVPKLRPGQYVIFDNVSFHKQKEMIELIRSAGARVVFLPPYSPDLSPIEKMWSKMKEVLKKNKPRTKADFHMALSAALSSMNDGDFEEWYDACGYSLAA